MHSILFLLIAGIATLTRSVAIPAELAIGDVDSMSPERTCRWTNCNESCPAGFSAVLRNGGRRGEMMWDHSHCLNKGSMTFCCPSGETQAICTWRGHRNSGKCQPGCNKDEVEVWTLKFGCKTGHQSACCTTDTASVSAYNSCRWEGCLDLSHYNPPYCSRNYPHLVALAPSGFGGEDICSIGQRRYCCKGDEWVSYPPAFSECSWARDLPGPLGRSLSCNAACPPNYTKLALRQSDCDVGEEAYCCKGFKPSEALKTSPKVLEFEAALNSYISAYDSKTCPLEDKPRRADWLEENEGAVHDSEPEITAENAGDIPDLPPCLLWTRVVSEMRDIIKRPELEWSFDQKQIANSWERNVPTRWPRTSVADLAAFLRENPISSPDTVVNTVLYSFDEWAGVRDAFKMAKTKICVEVQVGPAVGESDPDTRELPEPNEPALNTSHNIQPRSVDLDLDLRTASGWRDKLNSDSPHYTPWLGRIFHGIRIGRLTLHYARWEWYHGNGRGFAAGPFLELAYWIGHNAGEWNPQLDRDFELWRYRDLTTQHRNPNLRDRWVVFHLHFDPTREIFFDFNGHTFTGYTAVVGASTGEATNKLGATPHAMFSYVRGTVQRGTCVDALLPEFLLAQIDTRAVPILLAITMTQNRMGYITFITASTGKDGTNFLLPDYLEQSAHPHMVSYRYDIGMPNAAPQPWEEEWQMREFEPHIHHPQRPGGGIFGIVGGANLTNGSIADLS
ncbi:uncharacterized protein K460DRAFT_422442 [Cucurbitaria berberidis CBS 394.84]|uniref:Uncharacterized protein n=1 Tax=Cucurbitaria berberidis CBS 394.84 TaxID=1168544 RepID=A0A9P4GRP7_9PLEO|nr:uncharacterized protein K460DRAFT_422442 [Cucurbitaria berberidis CBS 394.84]KAF1850059.1 hypothetical protein K460DRAFT_422442 [Cucurbitaria berberidis CBS 394.84]